MNFKNKKWLIVGGGVSGRSAAKYLLASGARVQISDTKPLADNFAKELVASNVDLIIGPQTAALAKGIDGVVVSPGVPERAPLLEACRNAGIPIVTEIDLALTNFKGRVIGITGTNGKSTTTVMIEHILKKAGIKAVAGGNLGLPASSLTMPGADAPDVLVLELSSYQLEQSRNIRATAAVFTSFSHDHMGRHGSMENYFAAKWRLFADMPGGGLAVMTPDIAAYAKKLGLHLKATCELVGSKEAEAKWQVDRTKINEVHNRLNASFAIAVATHVSRQPATQLAAHLYDFRGLPFRFELVGTIKKQPVYNDSKSTNVESVLTAMQSIQTPCVLMLGGQSKDEPFGPILDQFGKRIQKVLIFGASGPEIYKHLEARAPCVLYKTLGDLMRQLPSALPSAPAPLVFSPGCASFDEFDNFEHRGRFFSEQIRPLLDT